ncbi:hypothetical protein V494_02444 [Pseudogymnoascus sp. VKM F-4513 (FW-928)]|nr:hypothetical protein V494_02444 [Pseudogymnoascus sp. VKM F-4513 (FW-928)]
MASYLVTGSSRGLGLAMVTHLANSSPSEARFIFAAARSQTPDLKELVKKSSGRVVYIDMDTTNQASVDKAVKAIEIQLGDKGLDYLVNNAGVGGFAPEWTEKMTDLNEEFNVNVTGTHIVITKFLPLLRKGTAKKITSIASTMGSLTLAEPFGVYPLPAYKISKAALNALTVQWALALSGEGFVVTAINPGTVKSAMGGGDIADLTLEQGARGILEALVKGGAEKNGTSFMIEVAGWENSTGVHQYNATLCENPDIRVNSPEVSRGVAKLSDHIAVKYGRGITDEEIANQNFAYGYSLTSDIKVPKIHRFFRIDDKAYIVMDFIEGVTLDEINCRENPGLIERLALAIHSLFSQIPCGPPGPANGGIPRGYLFSEDGALTTFNTIPKLNQWMNKRLRTKDGEPGFDFTVSECVFYHQDLARRNIIMRPDGSFALLDWEHAGFYPRICAAYCLQFLRISDWEFANGLLETLETLWPKTENRDELLKMLNRVYQNNLRYSYFPEDHPARFENFCKNNGITIPATRKPPVVYPFPPPDFPSPPTSPSN